MSEALSLSRHLQICRWVILALVALGLIGRFLKLEESPPGFHHDEAAGAIHVICIRQTGADGAGVPFPLFSESLGVGGLSTPAFLYFGVVWTQVFGVSISSFRSIAAFFTTLTILGLYLLVNHLFNEEAALFTALAATLSPWSFQFSRISWDHPLMPCFLVWATYFLLRSQRMADSILSGALFSLAMYTYPPAKVQVPLLLVPLLWIKKTHHGLPVKPLIAFLACWIITALPLVPLTLSGELGTRVAFVSIFSKDYFNQSGDSYARIALIFLYNIWLHFTPTFLFISGDPSVVSQ